MQSVVNSAHKAPEPVRLRYSVSGGLSPVDPGKGGGGAGELLYQLILIIIFI